MRGHIIRVLIVTVIVGVLFSVKSGIDMSSDTQIRSDYGFISRVWTDCIVGVLFNKEGHPKQQRGNIDDNH